MKNCIYLLLLVVLVASCTSQRQFTYFKDLPDTLNNYNIADTGYQVLTVKPDDVLQINISSPNPEATSFFMMQGSSVTEGSSGTSATAAAPNTYLVNKEGGIDLPLVGTVEVAGLSTSQVKQAVKTKVAPYLRDPIVNVRLQNFKITVLGEVAKPANYIVPNERVSVLDALGMAGDLTIFGRRENVLLVRETEGKKTMVRLNLQDSRLFQSPYYYLQQNDILYVEPTKQRVANSDMTTIRNVSIITSLASLATILVSQLVR